MKRTTRTSRRRLTREGWLTAALDQIARQGSADFRIDRLAEAVGVSKGSFYWHFQNRDDFVHALAGYWIEYTNGQVIRRLREEGGDASAKLRLIMQIVVEQDLSRHDAAMRMSAAREPVFAAAVRRVYRQRLETVRKLFEELGFVGDELIVRTRAMVAYFSLEPDLASRPSRKQRLRELDEVHALLTRR
ncbi:MAG: TetR/AcrR family transcriptional regulator [Planctomycetota bacterium]